jgi:hypothetical protein
MAMKIKCLKCNDIIQSKYRHDFKYCKRKNVFVDGGNDYLKYGVEDLSTIEIIKEK